MDSLNQNLNEIYCFTDEYLINVPTTADIEGWINIGFMGNLVSSIDN